MIGTSVVGDTDGAAKIVLGFNAGCPWSSTVGVSSLFVYQLSTNSPRVRRTDSERTSDSHVNVRVWLRPSNLETSTATKETHEKMKGSKAAKEVLAGGKRS